MITQEDALRLAEQELLRRNRKMLPPLRVKRSEYAIPSGRPPAWYDFFWSPPQTKRPCWVVVDSVQGRGGGGYVTLDEETGEVVDCWMPFR